MTLHMKSLDGIVPGWLEAEVVGVIIVNVGDYCCW